MQQARLAANCCLPSPRASLAAAGAAWSYHRSRCVCICCSNSRQQTATAARGRGSALRGSTEPVASGHPLHLSARLEAGPAHGRRASCPIARPAARACRHNIGEASGVSNSPALSRLRSGRPSPLSRLASSNIRAVTPAALQLRHPQIQLGGRALLSSFSTLLAPKKAASLP